MEDILGLIVEQFVKRARDNEQARRGAPGAPPAAAPAAPAVSGARSAATAAPASASSVAPPTLLSVSLRSDLPSPDAADPFGSVLAPQTGAPSALATAPSLLGAFAGGNAFITAFVLAEALAPPVALREKP